MKDDIKITVVATGFDDNADLDPNFKNAESHYSPNAFLKDENIGQSTEKPEAGSPNQSERKRSNSPIKVALSEPASKQAYLSSDENDDDDDESDIPAFIRRQMKGR